MHAFNTYSIFCLVAVVCSGAVTTIGRGAGDAVDMILSAARPGRAHEGWMRREMMPQPAAVATVDEVSSLRTELPAGSRATTTVLPYSKVVAPSERTAGAVAPLVEAVAESTTTGAPALKVTTTDLDLPYGKIFAPHDDGPAYPVLNATRSNLKENFKGAPAQSSTAVTAAAAPVTMAAPHLSPLASPTQPTVVNAVAVQPLVPALPPTQPSQVLQDPIASQQVQRTSPTASPMLPQDAFRLQPDARPPRILASGAPPGIALAHAPLVMPMAAPLARSSPSVVVMPVVYSGAGTSNAVAQAVQAAYAPVAAAPAVPQPPQLVMLPDSTHVDENGNIADANGRPVTVVQSAPLNSAGSSMLSAESSAPSVTMSGASRQPDIYAHRY